MSLTLFGFCTTLLVPLFLAAYYQFVADPILYPQPSSTLYFFEALGVTFIFALFLYYFGRNTSGTLYRREALAIVVALWLLLPALSALPFYFAGVLKNPFMAYFEAMSGLTTTGATTMQAKHFDPQTGKEIPIKKTIKGTLNTTYRYFGTIDPIRNPETGKIEKEGLEAVNKAILFWRSFIQWLGGGGIIVLYVAILPILGAGGRILFHTEVAGPIKESLTPRIKETAINLWKIYLALTVIIIFLLFITNFAMPWLDILTITFSALSTGGFSIHDENISFYHSAATEWVVIIAMLIGSINFSVYYYVWKGKLFKIFKPELFLFGIAIAIASLFAFSSIVGTPDYTLTRNEPTVYEFGKALRDGTFQVVSSISTTGFATANYDKWPYVAQAVMLIVMFVGGMSGSTSGGIKIMRHYMLFRITQFKIESLFRPKKVQKFKIEGKEVDDNSTTMVLTFFLILITLSVAGTFLYILDGIDPQTAIGTVACMINCTGLSFGMAGPTDSCAFMSDFSLIVSSLLMVLGRLEFFAVLAVLVPAFWKQDK